MSGKTVTRADLYQAIYQKVGLSATQSAALVELVLKEITDCLERGETVKLSSFGLFVVRKKGQRMGRNPKTGEGSADFAPPCRRVQAFRDPQAADQCASFPISMRAVRDKSEPQPNVGPRRVFAKIKETEHSPFRPSAIKRNFSNERTNADGGEPPNAVGTFIAPFQAHPQEDHPAGAQCPESATQFLCAGLAGSYRIQARTARHHELHDWWLGRYQLR